MSAGSRRPIERKEMQMPFFTRGGRKRLLLTLSALATVIFSSTGSLLWVNLADGQVKPLGVAYTIATPTLVQVTASTHNGGSVAVCGAPVPATAGSEYDGVIENGAGSYLGAVHLPQGATVTRFELTAHDNTTPADVFAFLVRKNITPQKDFVLGYDVLASVRSNGAVNSARAFSTTSIRHGVIDNHSFGYFVELVNCDSTINPIALQIGYVTG
jgi:hypothetical protein